MKRLVSRWVGVVPDAGAARFVTRLHADADRDAVADTCDEIDIGWRSSRSVRPVASSHVALTLALCGRR
jgi:hypothetical protein